MTCSTFCQHLAWLSATDHMCNHNQGRENTYEGIGQGENCEDRELEQSTSPCSRGICAPRAILRPDAPDDLKAAHIFRMTSRDARTGLARIVGHPTSGTEHGCDQMYKCGQCAPYI